MLAKIIIADKRETGISRALSTSHRLMKGRKLKGFWLMYLSFFFWYILMFMCGPAALWIAPYIACTTIIFYMDADGTLWQLTDAGKPKAEEVHAEAAADMNISVPTAEDAADKTAAADAETAAVTETAADAVINADEGTNTDAATNADEGSNAATATNADGEAGD